MPLFEIPICERIMSVGKIYRLGKKTEVMNVDNVGFFLHYDEEWQKNEHGFIRDHLRQRIYEEFYIEAANVHEALKKFYDECEGTKIGGQQKDAKALWINDKKFIYELPYCHHMSRNERGNFVCEDCRMCVLENYEAPEKCIISVFRDCICDYGEKELARAARNVVGFKFIELRTLMPF